MKESAERTVKVGFSRDPKKIFDEVEAVTADMIRQGWAMQDAVVEEGLGNIHLLFERDAGDCGQSGHDALRDSGEAFNEA
jgi:hypothetical protein